jgi:hypothetical protein
MQAHMATIERTLANHRGNPLGDVEKSVPRHMKNPGDAADQFFAAVVSEFWLLVLDLRGIRERDAHLVPQRPLREMLGFSQISEPFAELHVPPSPHACQEDPVTFTIGDVDGQHKRQENRQSSV